MDISASVIMKWFWDLLHVRVVAWESIVNRSDGLNVHVLMFLGTAFFGHISVAMHGVCCKQKNSIENENIKYRSFTFGCSNFEIKFLY
jgi:hypothetical protein